MKTDKQIKDAIEARTAEMQGIADSWNKKKAQVEKTVSDFNQETFQVQLRLNHLNGCREELQAMLPKPKAKKKK